MANANPRALDITLDDMSPDCSAPRYKAAADALIEELKVIQQSRGTSELAQAFHSKAIEYANDFAKWTPDALPDLESRSLTQASFIAFRDKVQKFLATYRSGLRKIDLPKE
jgi:hypothetical protein